MQQEYPTTVYKIVEADKEFDTSIEIQPLSDLDRNDGFIHLSTRQQLQGTLERFYATHDKVNLLYVDLSKVKDPVKWELPREADLQHLKFPHIYGPLRTEYITTCELIHSNQGRWFQSS